MVSVRGKYPFVAKLKRLVRVGEGRASQCTTDSIFQDRKLTGVLLVFEYRTGKSPKQENKNLPGIVPSKRHHAIFLHPKERRKKKKTQ